MKNILAINTTYGVGSTGKIVKGIGNVISSLEDYHYECICGYSTIDSSAHSLENSFTYKRNALTSRIFSNDGFCNSIPTKNIVNDNLFQSADLIHLHNLHGHYIDSSRLFSFLSNKRCPIVWTFHDCWPFTGNCPYYLNEHCDKWKRCGCKGCTYPLSNYPQRLINNSAAQYSKKEKLFTGFSDMVIVTPSVWLANEVKKSFFHNTSIITINNGIDLSIFRYRNSGFRNKYNCSNKKVILGVASDWGYRKGLDVFIELSKVLDESFQIVLVGITNKQSNEIPDNIIGIDKTNNQIELAEIYSAADVFLNPTREDNYPTTHMESLACGTPVITFNTGGSSENVKGFGGVVLNDYSIDYITDAINYLLNNKPSIDRCMNMATAFDENKVFQQYSNLYSELLSF